MNILFLTLSNVNNIEDEGIYTDLIRTFSNEGHHVTVMSPIERKHKKPSHKKNQGNVEIHKIKIGNITKINKFEKGISTITIDSIFKNYFKKKLYNQKFDLILYSTPPLTFINSISYIKKKTNAMTYLLLKDIFPQNAVDLQMIKNKSLIHNFFLKKEKKLYVISDFIGCMSKANCEYILKHNGNIIEKSKVHELPNSIELSLERNADNKESVREKFDLPQQKRIFIYGGNIGKPQNIFFLLNNLGELEKECENAFFIIVGSGTEFKKAQKFIENHSFGNIKILDSLPKTDFDQLVNASDVGLILLDSRFTIPNFPSRILSYMEAKLPVLAATDTATDIGKIIEDNKFGMWCVSNDPEKFIENVKILASQSLEKYSINSYNFLKENYVVSKSYETIMMKIKEK